MDVSYGTSADTGILVDGFPRESTAAVEVGGVRYLLLEGEPLCIRHGVDALALVCDHPQQCALVRGDADAR